MGDFKNITLGKTEKKEKEAMLSLKCQLSTSEDYENDDCTETKHKRWYKDFSDTLRDTLIGNWVTTE